MGNSRDSNLPLLLLGLAGVVGFYWWTRTREDGQATSDAFDAAMRAAREAAGDVYSGAASIVDRGRTIMTDLTAPRGIRNHNPGNIERGASWQGMSPDQSADARFVVFSAPEWGIRAIVRIIRTYMGRGQRSIAQIVSTWAPMYVKGKFENDTTAYIARVSQEVGIPPNVPVPEDKMPALIAAIIRHENGVQPYPPEVIAKGIQLERSA